MNSNNTYSEYDCPSDVIRLVLGFLEIRDGFILSVKEDKSIKKKKKRKLRHKIH